MADEPLIRDRELTAPAFVRDLRSFLTQNVEVLQAISEAGDGPDGFTDASQSRDLNARYSIPINRATGCLRVAEYLYSRVAELELEVDDAVTQIVDVAAGLDEPIVVDEQHSEAVASVLSFKRGFEASKAIGTATSGGPHFIDVNGGWAVKPVRIRNGEVIKVPVIALSIVWHDGSGNNREAFLQMSERDWTAFRDKIEALTSSRRELDALL